MKTIKEDLFLFIGKNVTYLLVLLDIILQLILIGKYLDNSIMTAYAPTALDASEYSELAEIWKTDGFYAAFSDLWRMPGYPALILIMQLIFPSFPFLAMRILQLLALAVSVAMIKIILDRKVRPSVSIFLTIVYIFLPLWHFVPVLIAESLTSFFFVCLLYVLAAIKSKKLSLFQIAQIAALIAMETYLKPNLIYLIFPVSIFLMFKLGSNLKSALLSLILIIVICLSPWLIFANSAQTGFRGLTTTFGVNAYIGTGMYLNYDESVLAKSAIRWRVDPNSNPGDVFGFDPLLTRVEQNTMLTSKSIQIWKERPLREIAFGFNKVLIAFGLLSNSVIHHILGLFSLLSIVSALALVKARSSHPWGWLLLSTSSILASQAFFLQADRRFVFPILFPLSVVVIGLVMESILYMKVQDWTQRVYRGATKLRMIKSVKGRD